MLRVVADRSKDKLEDLSDDQLMVLVRGDHRAAFDALVRRHQSLVLTYAHRYIGDRDAALDVGQECFAALWRTRASYEPRGRFKSYLLGVAHNRCREVARGRRGQQARVERVREQGGESASATDAAPLQALLERERAAALHEKLQQLDDNTRQALLLRFASDLSYEQIAEVTGTKRVGTLKSRVCRGVQRLRSLLAEEYRA